MVRRNTLRMAADRYLEPFQRAMGCISHGTLFSVGKRRYVIDEVNAILLNDIDPFLIRTNPDIYLTASQRFRIERDESVPEGPFRAHTIEYFYQFRDEGTEFLNFHWTPEATTDLKRRTYPHMHICSGLFSEPPILFSDRFHKLHVPTGRVSFENIILFAIDELEVKAIIPNYKEILHREQHKFEAFRRKP